MLETGLSKSFLLKEIKLNEALNDWVSLSATHGIDYSLFGGTAANKIYLDNQRFSEDIDLFVYGSTPKKIFSLLGKEMKGFKRVKPPSRIFRQCFRCALHYSIPEEGIEDDEINFDVNFNLKHAKSERVLAEPKSFLNAAGFIVRNAPVSTFKEATLAAMKLLCVNGREEGKDYYDLFRLLQKNFFKKSEVMSEAYKYHDSFFDFAWFNESFLSDAVNAVERADAKKLALCDQFILVEYRPEWSALKRDLVRLIRTRVV